MPVTRVGVEPTAYGLKDRFLGAPNEAGESAPRPTPSGLGLPSPTEGPPDPRHDVGSMSTSGTPERTDSSDPESYRTGACTETGGDATGQNDATPHTESHTVPHPASGTRYELTDLGTVAAWLDAHGAPYAVQEALERAANAPSTDGPRYSALRNAIVRVIDGADAESRRRRRAGR